MRTRSLAAVLVMSLTAACGGAEPPPKECVVDGRTYAEGARWTPDGCNTCSCERGQAQCTLIGCEPLDAGMAPSCAPAGGCTTGVACGAGCCGAGERCLGTLCVCGEAGQMCGEGDVCAAAGPSSEDQCGVSCCGASGPCPL